MEIFIRLESCAFLLCEWVYTSFKKELIPRIGSRQLVIL